MIPHAEKNDDFDEKEYIQDANSKKTKWSDWLLLNKPLKVIIILVLATIVAPLLTYHFLFYSSNTSIGSCLIARSSRLPCGYGNIPASECSSECCYDHTNGICFHRFPSRFTYFLNETWNEDVDLSPTMGTVPYGSRYQRPKSIEKIRISIDEISASHLSLTFYKSDQNITGRRIEDKNYVYSITGPKLNVVVNATQGNIFNTAHGTFIAADDIWEITFKITSETMYGLGEIPLLPNTVKVIYNHKGGMSAIPLIFAKLNGSYHGLLIDTKNPTEVNIRQENQMVVRSITNVGLKFHLFVGPKPSDIMRDVMTLTEKNNTDTFEYWMLGPHYCSQHATVDDLHTFVNTAERENIPLESHCGIATPHLSNECNSTYVDLVNEGATVIKNSRRKFIPHVSPYIRYTAPEIPETEVTTEKEESLLTTTESEELVTLDVMNSTESCFDEEEFKQYIIRDPNTENIYLGLVDDYDVIYPSYDNVSAEFMKRLWVYNDVDGVILQNNWPLDESEKSVNQTHLLLPYFNENFERAFEYTPKWNATLPDKDNQRYLYTHNEYGNQFATAFNMVKETGPIISTSQWMNGNTIINRQNIETSWASLHRELIEASLGGISGHWFWSSPICGDTENFDSSAHIRLCAKWYMASAYFPMIQIHSKDIRRDPLAYTGSTKAHMVTALKTRMSIMTYLYAVLKEGPLLRPMFYQFPFVEELANVTTQFSVGDDLLIIPNLRPGQTHVHVWMPPGQWFEFGGGFKLEAKVGEAVTMATTEADFLTLVRGGTIIIQQTDARSRVHETQFNTYTVLVVLHCETRNATEEVEITTQVNTETETLTENANVTTISICSAEGKFHMSPNLTILFEADNTTLKITAEGDDFGVVCGWNDAIWSEQIWYLKVYGLEKEKNNNDHHLMQDVSLYICDLERMDEIIYQYL